MSETKVNLIEKELRKKVQKNIRSHIKTGVHQMMKDMPSFRFDTVRFDLHENHAFSVFDENRGRLHYGELQFSPGSDNDRIENFIYSVLSQCFEERLLDEEVKHLIKKATLLDE
tara:strand:- start:145 stop:486 length:342 start_codon:yes stop_codon:yes gene_type:complete